MAIYNQTPDYQKSIISEVKQSTKWWNVVHVLFGAFYTLFLTKHIWVIFIHLVTFVGVLTTISYDEKDDEPKRVKDTAYHRLLGIIVFVTAELLVEFCAGIYISVTEDRLFGSLMVVMLVAFAIHVLLDLLFLRLVPFQHFSERIHIKNSINAVMPENVMLLHDLANCSQSFIGKNEVNGYILAEESQIREIAGTVRANKLINECKVDVFIIDSKEQLINQIESINSSASGMIKRYVFLDVSKGANVENAYREYAYNESIYFKHIGDINSIDAYTVTDIFMNISSTSAGSLVNEAHNKARARWAIKNIVGNTTSGVYAIVYKAVKLVFALFLLWNIFILFKGQTTSIYSVTKTSLIILAVAFGLSALIRFFFDNYKIDIVNKVSLIVVAFLYFQDIVNNVESSYYVYFPKSLEFIEVAIIIDCVLFGLLYRSKERATAIQIKKDEKKEAQLEKEVSKIIVNEVSDKKMVKALSSAFDDPMQYCELIKHHCKISLPEEYHYEKMRVFLFNAISFKNISRSTMALIDYIEMSLRLVHYYVLLKNNGEDTETSSDNISLNLNEMAANIYLNSDVLATREPIKLNVLEKTILSELANKTDLIIEGDQMDFNGFVYLIKIIRDKVIAHGVFQPENGLQIWCFFVYSAILLTKYLRMGDFVIEGDDENVRIGYINDGCLLDAGEFVHIKDGEPYIACLVPREKKNYHRVTYANYFSGALIIPNYVED